MTKSLQTLKEPKEVASFGSNRFWTDNTLTPTLSQREREFFVSPRGSFLFPLALKGEGRG